MKTSRFFGSIQHRQLFVSAALLALPLSGLLPGCGGGSNSNFSPNPTTPSSGGTPAATAGGTPRATPGGTAGATAMPSGTSRPNSTPRATATAARTQSPNATPASTPIDVPTPAGAPNFFDAFLFDNGGQPANDYNAFFQWNVSGGTVDLRGGNVPGANDAAQINGRFIDLDGGDAGRFATRVPLNFVGGRTYNLSFTYMSTDGKQNAATATIGTQTFRVNTASRSPQNFSRNFSFPLTSPLTAAPLAFQDAGNDDNGIGIDNVVVSALP